MGTGARPLSVLMTFVSCPSLVTFVVRHGSFSLPRTSVSAVAPTVSDADLVGRHTAEAPLTGGGHNLPDCSLVREEDRDPRLLERGEGPPPNAGARDRIDVMRTNVRPRTFPYGIAAEVFGSLGTMGFNVELVVSTGGTQGTADICLAVAANQQDAVGEALEEIRTKTMGTWVVTDSEVALVSVVGSNLSKVPGVAGRMFKALSGKGINIEIISTSLSSVTCLIPKDKTVEAVAALEGEFLAERTPD